MKLKLRRGLGVGLLALTMLLPQGVFADYIRPNEFMDKSGAERTAEIKKFQARNNLEVTGTLNQRTKDILYNPKLIAYDIVENAPSNGYWITINKSRRILTLYKGKQSMGKYPVALGKRGSATPSYKAKITNKFVNPAWGGNGGKGIAADDPNNPLGERWMGLYVGGKPGYGIHGTVKPYEIGGYYSSGCIRMFNYDIETYVFPAVNVGAPVWIGNDEELAKWGVRQIIDISAEPVNKEKPAETEQPKEPAKPDPMEAPREAVTVLEF